MFRGNCVGLQGIKAHRIMVSTCLLHMRRITTQDRSWFDSSSATTLSPITGAFLFQIDFVGLWFIIYFFGCAILGVAFLFKINSLYLQ